MDDDPGWKFRWRRLPLMLFVPRLAVRRTLPSGSDRLLDLRSLFLTLCGMLAVISLVVVTLGDIADGPDRTVLSIAIVMLAGMLSLVVTRIASKPLDCTSDSSLATSYITRFYARIAYSESVALIGFVVEISLGPWWVYYVGLAFTAVGFARLAPTRRNLAREQSALDARSCRHLLVPALRGSMREPVE